jgi:hypothetical protein
MKETRLKSAGALAKAPLLGQLTVAMTSLPRTRNNRASIHETFGVCHRATSSWRFGRNASQSDVSSLDFQTCRSRPPGKSAGREAAPEVGLEIWAAAARAAILLTI